jgi:hypothetical protein
MSCKKDESIKQIKNSWDTIILENGNQEIIIYNETDTASFKKLHFEKVPHKNGIVNYKLKSVEKNTFKLNKKERDTIHKLVYEIITKPTFTDKAATCYAGNIQISLKDRHTTLMCSYNSVGIWSDVSKNTKNLYNLLKTKIEISK